MENSTEFQTPSATSDSLATLPPKSRLLYIVTLLACVATWFFAYRAPLWLDETVSYWEISGGLRQICTRTVEGLSFPAYFYVLWLTRQELGSREVMLRIPSVLAMSAAVYVLYRIARELFHEEVAFLACILFSLHREVAFAAIDVRPYSFAVLATTIAIYALIIWIRNPTPIRSVLLGASCAFILYFQYVYAVILPAFLMAYLLYRNKSAHIGRRRVALVLGTLGLLAVPIVSRMMYISSRRNTYSFLGPPPLVHTFLFFLIPALPMAFLNLRGSPPAKGENRIPYLICLVLAFLPTEMLYLISVTTPMHVYVARYTLVGIIGTALLWGFAITQTRWAFLQIAFCSFFVPCAIFFLWLWPNTHRHEYTWKAALDYAQRIAEPAGMPLLICSDLPQSDFEPMPSNPEDSVLFAPLSYYKVTVPVVPLPRSLTPQAKQIGSSVLMESWQAQRRFLMLAFPPSFPTVQWLIGQSIHHYEIQFRGNFDGVVVVEFRPKNPDEVSADNLPAHAVRRRCSR